MTQVAQDQEFQTLMRRLNERLEAVDSITDPEVRDATADMIQTLMEVHGQGLARIMSMIEQTPELGADVINDLAQDPAVSGLLLLYGMHPQSLDERVARALEKVRPMLASHGGNVALVSISDDAAVRLRLEGSCHGCASSTTTMKNLVEQAIYDLAPEVSAIVVDGIEAPATHRVDGFVPVGQLLASHNKLSLQGTQHA